MADSIVFSRDVAVLAAQIAPVLVVAFVIEFRAIAERRSMEGRDARFMIWFVFGALGVLLLLCLFVVNRSEDLRGQGAILAWVVTLLVLVVLILYVAFAAWAAVRISSKDADDARAHADAQRRHLQGPGWRWLFHGQREPIHVVAAVITRSDGAVLAARRKAEKSSAGKWEFPGGKVEVGELPAEALIREIREELNVQIRIVEPLTSDITAVGSSTIRLSCFIVKVVGKAPKVSTDHDKLVWLARDELGKLDWAAPDLPAVHLLRKQD